MAPQPPAAAEVQTLLRRAGLSTTAEDVSYLDAGWDTWAFRAGNQVVRLSKSPADPDAALRFAREAAATAYLAPLLPLPISTPVVHHGEDYLFTTHTMVPGVPLRDLRRPPAAGTGLRLGGFVRALHAVDPAPLAALGLEVVDGGTYRQRRIQRYEALAPRIFPLLNCETRSFITTSVAEHVNNPACFAYTPVVAHNDIDSRNVLADPQTGELTGIIDFGDIEIGNPAADVEELYAGGFPTLDEDEVAALVRSSGVSPALLEARCGFVPLWWLLLDIELALDTGDSDLLREAIESLNARTPFGTACLGL